MAALWWTRRRCRRFHASGLGAGARRVLAVDRGRDQLDPRLLADGRVESLEQRDLREIRELPAPVRSSFWIYPLSRCAK